MFFESDAPNELRYDSHADIRTTGGAPGIVVGVDDDAPGRQVRVRNFGSVVTEDADEERRGNAMVVWANHANVEATNEAGATIETSGNGDRGLAASTTGTGATAKAVNRGSVTTTGDLDDNDRGADAVRADSDGPDLRTAEVVNEAGATVRTEGDGARGLFASSCNWDGTRCTRSGTGSATAINRGSVTTTGNGAVRSGGGTRSANAVSAYLDGDGTARAVNEAGGMIRTEGTGARGLNASHEGSLGGAEAENEGDITTTGGMDSALRQSHGLSAWSQERSARAVNHEGATIVTEGVAADGMIAQNQEGTTGDSATATNHGSITVRGDGFFNEDTFSLAQGVYAVTDEGSASSATALNDETGTVETHGKGSRGVEADAFGSGDAESVNRGRITTRGDAFPIDRQDSDGDTYRGATGLAAFTQGSGSASARNEAGGIVETHGTAATGLGAWSEGGTASVVNQGQVTTHQTAAVDDLPGSVGTLIGARGAWAWSVSDALVENEETGRVETMGARAFGLFAETENDGSQESAMAQVDNRGTVITHGPNADGMAAIANNGGAADNPDNAGDATVVNTGQVTVSGAGARGLYAGTSGAGATAKAVNRGSVTTTGDLDDNDRDADAVRADSNGPDLRTAEVVNEAGATVRTEGDGARGLFASSCNWDGARCTRSGEGSATAINQGSVTTTGNGAARSDSSIRNADAVFAYLDGDGTARAVNEAGGTIRTEGTGARGLSAVHEGSLGGAEAENEGDITTTGGMDSALRRSHGLHVFSQERSARAVNQEGATIVTTGVAARGMGASIDRGTADDDSATAINRGSITTHGDGFFNEDIDRIAEGVGAYAGFADEGGAVSSATALNDETGTVETHGRGAAGVVAGTAGSGDAESVNRGRITTRGDAFPIDRQNDEEDDFSIAIGLAAFTDGSGSASARNEVDGIVETHGTAAIGLGAWSEGGTASVVNQGRVTTHQTAAVDDLPGYVGTPFGAHGAWAWSVSDALVENEETGRVETMGAWAAGLFAEIENDGSQESAVARVDNRGTVITHGPNADGVAAIANNGGAADNPDNAGDATVVNTGQVTVSGAGAVGLYAGTSGTGAATVTMTGGEVTASHADDPATSDVDEGGVGILAETGDAGRIAVRVEDGARVEAPTAVRLVGGSGIDAATLDVIGGGTLTGRVDLTQAVNGARVTVAGGSRIDGDCGLRRRRRRARDAGRRIVQHRGNGPRARDDVQAGGGRRTGERCASSRAAP